MSAHPSQLLAQGLVRALVSAGVRDVVYCPGSRSAPLAYALADAERAGTLRIHVRLDERGAAFLAVGLSRAGMLSVGVPLPMDEGDATCAGAPSGGAGAVSPGAGPTSTGLPGSPDLAGTACTRAGARAVAVVTTSGGAVAELHAGVAEASHSHLPLVVISADRPFELRGVGASQTTTQPGIFGPHVRAGWDVPADTPADRRLGALVARAVATAVGAPAGEPGPAHLNVAFRDPLVPDPTHPRAGTDGADADAATVPTPQVLRATAVATPWEDVVDPTLRTVVVAGDGANPHAAEWAEAAGIPLLAEPTSGVTTSPAWLPHQQALVSEGGPGADVEQVVVTGRTTLSRSVSALLARRDVRLVVQAEDPHWADAAGGAAVVVPALLPAPAPHPDGGWRRRWVEASHVAGCRVRDLVATAETAPPAPTAADTAPPDPAAPGAAVPATTQPAAPDSHHPHALPLPAVATAVWESPAGILLLGASNTVRAVDLVATAPGRVDVVSNRGLAGIDGTIATALGLAWGSGRPVHAVMGDLTFLHDASSLAMTEGEVPPDVQLIVLDDHGGSIFAGLEHGRPEYAEDFPRWFATPQTVSVSALASAYGATHREVVSVADLREVLAAPVRGVEVVHVPVRRDPALLAALARACGGEGARPLE